MNFLASVFLKFVDQFSVPLNVAKNNLTGIQKNLDSMKANNNWGQMAMEMQIQAQGFRELSGSIQNMINQPSQLAQGLDSAFTNIQTVTQKTNREMWGLSDSIMQIGGRSTVGLQAAANSFYDIAGGVADSSTHLAILQASINLAEAGQANLGATTKGLISVMNSYKATAEQTSAVSDILTRTVGLGVGSMDDFVSAIGPLAGLTASADISFQDLGTAMAFMTTQGASASMSATRIQAAIVALMKPNKDMSDAISAAGYASGTAMMQQLGLAGAMNELSNVMGGSQDAMAGALGSTEALQGMLALTKDGFSEFAKNFESGMNGITESSQKVQLQSYTNKLALLSSAKEVFSQKVGKATNAIRGFGADIMTWVFTGINKVSNAPVLGWLPAFIAGLGTATSSALGFASSTLSVTAQVATIANVATKGGDILKLFGNVAGLAGLPFKLLGSGIMKLIPVVWSFTASLLANPITWIVLGVVALAGVVFLLIKNWSVVKDFFIKLWTQIKGLFASAWSFIWNTLLGNKYIQIALAIFMPFIGIPILIIKHFGAIKSFFVGLWSGITSGVTGFITGITNIFTGFFDFLFSMPGKIIETLMTGLKNSDNPLFQLLYGILDKVALLLPHSDAKIGPLSELTLSGKRLITTIAEGVESEPALNETVARSLNVIDDNNINVQRLTGKGSSGESKEIHIHINNIESLVKNASDIKDIKDFVTILASACGVAI